MSRRYRYLAAFGMGLVLLSAAALSQEEQFEFAVQTNTHGEAGANGALAHPADHPTSSVAEAHGAEHSDPGAGEERQSAGGASATVSPGERRVSSVSAVLTASARANGGHLVRCQSSTPLFGCVGRFPEDTAGDASATSTWIATIKFKEHARPIRYRLRVAADVQGPPASFQLQMVDEAGAPVGLTNGSTGTAELIGKANSAFRITASLQAAATNRGGCCLVSTTSSAALTISVTRAPIIASTSQAGGMMLTKAGAVRRIVGGVPTNGYPLVGAVLLDDELQCTGTVVGPHTVLTAGHCGYLVDPPTRLSFVQGANVFAPSSRRGAQTFLLPDGSGGGPKYDDFSLADDIGLLVVGGDPIPGGMKMHAGVPLLKTLLDAHLPLTFVGYGYDVVEGQHVQAGLKRMVNIPMNQVDDRQFLYQQAGKNTCNGDSGGPAFLADGGKLYVAGITSSGDEDCTQYGIDTRVEYYAKWVADRIK